MSKIVTVYEYDPITKEYIGNSIAQCDPKNMNEILLPPNTTDMIPLDKLDDHQTQCFINNRWEVIPDYRGIWYNIKTKERISIENIGELLPENLDQFTEIMPTDSRMVWRDGEWTLPNEILENDTKDKVKNIVIRYIRLAQDRIDRYRNQKDILVETTESEETIKEILYYMQYLREYNDILEDPQTFEEWRKNNG